MPVAQEKNPGRQMERVQRAGAVEGVGQKPKVSLDQLPSPREQAHGDEEISVRKKWTP
jgi:hypothetical protein